MPSALRTTRDFSRAAFKIGSARQSSTGRARDASFTGDTVTPAATAARMSSAIINGQRDFAAQQQADSDAAAASARQSRIDAVDTEYKTAQAEKMRADARAAVAEPIIDVPEDIRTTAPQLPKQATPTQIGHWRSSLGPKLTADPNMVPVGDAERSLFAGLVKSKQWQQEKADYWTKAGAIPRSVLDRIASGSAPGASASVTADRNRWLMTQVSDDTVNGLADYFASTGTLPAMGMGGMEFRLKVFERAMQRHPGANVALNSSWYKANTVALRDMTKNTAAVESFARTADKNAQVLRTYLNGLVDNAGAPLINRPLRWLEQNAAGNQYLPAFRTAMQVVRNEYARINSNPTLAGELTNEARAAFKEAINDDATPEQIVNALDVLVADSNNRITSGHETVDALRREIGSIAPPTEAPVVGAGGAAGGVGEVRFRRKSGGPTKVFKDTPENRAIIDGLRKNTKDFVEVSGGQ